MRWVFRLLLLGAFLVGGYVFRDRITGSPADLAVGDCFDIPAGVESVKDLQHHPCTESHTGEVFSIVTHPAPSGAPPPDATALREYLNGACGPTFVAFIGPTAASQALVEAGAFYPLEADWKRGERTVTCYAYRVDQKPMTSSMKHAP